MLRVIACSLFSQLRLQDELETEFLRDHGIKFSDFIHTYVINKSPYSIDWGKLNQNWDFTVLDLHKFTVKVIITPNPDTTNIRNILFNYCY